MAVLAASLVVALLSVSSIVRAAVINADPSNYRNALASLSAGDTLSLAPGAYLNGLPISNKSGTAAQPIVIVGPDDQSAIFKANDCCNTVQLENASHIAVRNLTLDGAGTNGAFGVDARGTTNDITIENLKIINYGGDQQVVGVSTKGPAWNWIVRRNTIIGAGTGMYFGNSDGTMPFVNGLIEYNLVVDTLGYNIQIKHQLPRPTNVGLPTGDSRTIIRHNVFSKQNGASTGDLARPNVLVGHFPLSGAGSNDRYEIYGNFFHQNPVEALFQGEGNIVLHDNLFVNTSGSAVNITSHNDKPRNVTVFHNTVLASGNGIRISNADTGYVQKIIANAVFAGTPISGPNQLGNVTGSYAAAADHLVAPTAPLGTLDLFPKAGQLAGTATDLAQFGGFADGTRDFNGSTRTGVHRGAYEGDGSNPGWRLALAIKPATGGTNPPAATVALSADPATVSLQGSTTLQWTATNAASCTASGGWSGTRGLSGSETVGPLAATTTFVLTCTGPGGSASRTVSVAVANGSPAPTVSISASPPSIAAGESTSLAWQSTNATGCEASGGWSGAKATDGNETVGPVQASTVYTLSCTGPGGSATAATSVSVAAAPTLTLQANPATVGAGQSATLTWTTTGANSCIASGDWAGNLATSGSQSTGALNATSTFVLACSGPGGSVTRQASVAVEAGGGLPAPGGGANSAGGGGGMTPLALLTLLALAGRRRRPGRLYCWATDRSGQPSG
jgi:uncharacterized protein (TIGR03382 family)